MSRTLCTSIDVGLFLDVNGDIRTCCAGWGALGNINDNPLDNIFADKKFIEIKQAVDNYQYPEYCKVCEKVESLSPGLSQQTFFNSHFTTNGTRKIKQLDLRWSNICNLSCRYCGPYASSSWEKLLDIPVKSANRGYHQSILDTVKENSTSIEQVNLLGGEPLMQKQNEDLFTILDPDTPITIITNLSVSLENNKIYQLLKNFNNVTWHISFENIGDRFEYVRYGASWSKLCHNIELLKKDFGKRIGFHAVYGIWSATRLREYYDFANQHNILVNWQLGILHDELSLFNYDTNIKQLAINEIDQLDPEHQSKFTDIRNSLITSVPLPEINIKLKQWIDKSEQLMTATKTFKELWPELDQALTLSP